MAHNAYLLMAPHNAYLLMRVAKRSGRLVIRDIHIYSEPTPTALRGEHYAFLASRAGRNYEEARNNLIEALRSGESGASWALEWVKE